MQETADEANHKGFCDKVSGKAKQARAWNKTLRVIKKNVVDKCLEMFAQIEVLSAPK